MGPNFHEDSEEVSPRLHFNPEEFNDTSQYVSIRGGTEKGFLPLSYTVGAKRHQSFRVCKNGDGSRVQQRVLKGQAGGSKFGPTRGAPPRASSDVAISASDGVVVVETCSHALVAV